MKRSALVLMVVLVSFGGMSLAAQMAAKPAPATAAAEVINLNTATANQLATLPGIGPKTAELIVQYRQKTPFKKIEEIMNVRGVGEKSFLRIRTLISVTPPKSEQ